MSKLLTTEELAEKLGVKPATIHQWSHRYPDFPTSGWDLEEVKRFLAKRVSEKRAK